MDVLYCIYQIKAVNTEYTFKLQIYTLYHLISFAFIFPYDHETFLVEIVRLYIESVGFFPRIYIIISAFPIRSSKGVNKV